MNPQQLAMENRVLRQEKQQLLQAIENMRASKAKDEFIESVITSVAGGLASQPRAGDNDGAAWVSSHALEITNQLIAKLELGIVQNDVTDQPQVTSNE